ncbi:MAG: acyl-CoA dehydrogenase family protein [Hyphomonadaceae bacterium]
MSALSDLRRVEIPPEDESLRADVRAFLREAVAAIPAARRARSWSGFNAEFSKALGARGWIGLTLPKEYGGAGRGQFARFVLVEELLAAGAPVAAHWIAERQSAPLILKFGTEAQRRFYVPRVCKGEAFFCIGMSEPNAGSDLASVRTRATRVENGWRLEGSKIWTTFGHKADYMIALVRTSGSAEDRNAGLSQFIVDLKLPGIAARPIRDLGDDDHFSEVHFDNVLLAEDALIGAEGNGWAQVTAELAFERSGPERIYSCMVLLDLWVEALRALKAPSESEIRLLGLAAARLATLRAMSLGVTQLLAEGQSPVVEASIVKDLGTTFEQSLPPLIGDQMAARDASLWPPALFETQDYLAGISHAFSLRGGTREILRGIIARGLGLR